MTEAADGAPPGWYPDPAGQPATFRWWDGAAWTDWLTGDDRSAAPDERPASERRSAGSSGDASATGVGSRPDPGSAGSSDSGAGTTPADPAPVPTARPGRARPPGYEYGRRTSATAALRAGTRSAPGRLGQGSAGATSGTGVETDAGPGGGTDGGGEERADPRLLRILGAAAAIAAVVVVGGVVVLGNRAPADPIALPPMTRSSADSSSSSTPSGGATGSAPTYDARDRRLTIGTFSTTLPGTPYLTASALQPVPSLFTTAVESQAVVHAKYDGRSDWTAGVLVGQLDPGVVVEGDAEATADKVLDGLAGFAFADVAVTRQKFTRQKVSTPHAKTAAILQGQLAYRVKNVPSHYDRVSLLVLELDDGTWVGWISTRPEKSSAAVKKALQTSIDTIVS